jgi:hypothetical protein
MFFLVLNTVHVDKSYLLRARSNPIIVLRYKEAGDNELYPLPSKLNEVARDIIGLPAVKESIKKRLTLCIVKAIVYDYLDEWETESVCAEGVLTDFVGWVLKKSMRRGYPPDHEGPAVALTDKSRMYLANLIVRKKARLRNGTFRRSIEQTLSAMRMSPYVSPYVLEAMRREAREERSGAVHLVEDE